MKVKSIVVAVAAVGLVSLGAWGGMHVGSPWTQAHAGTPAVHAAPAPTLVKLPNFTSIVDANRGAVVNITVTENEPTSMQSPFPDFGGNDPFSQFFRQFQVPVPKREMHGLGSGFIVRSDGIIMTNAHVVDGANHVTVKLSDRREFKAKVIGVDKQTDIAVLKIKATDLPTVKLGDSSKVQVGQWVLAIGSPYGFENTVTAGIVSATSRALPDGTYTPFIQTDAPINPGNSGGPLFNMQGQVIGINSQIYSQTGGFQGLAFAIPINLASQIEQQLLAHGKVERGRIGVTIQDVNQGLAQSFGLDKPGGALISSVEKDSPAARAGLESGDVILGMNGHKVSRSNQLPPMVAAVKPGDKATFEIWRRGHRKEITVTVGSFKGGTQVASASGNSAGKNRLGLAVRPLTKDEDEQAQINGGLLVEDAGGPAAAAGIQQGDVILAVNGNAVKSVAQLRKLVANAGKHVALLILRDNAKIFVPVDLG